MNTNRKGLVAVLSTIGIFAAVALLALGLQSHRAQADQVDPKAVQYGSWIKEQSALYQQKNAEVIDLQAKTDYAMQERDKAKEVAHGLRYSLCAEFKLAYLSGALVSSPACGSDF